MPEEFPIIFTGLENTKDKEYVGQSCFNMSNVSLTHRILEADEGYTVQIAASGSGVVQGGWFARDQDIEEYGKVQDNAAWTAGPSGTAWTRIATDVTDDKWEFQQYGSIVYGVSETGGLIKHTIGESDWVVTAASPGAGDNLHPIQWWYRRGDGSTSGSQNWKNIGDELETAAKWSVDQLSGDVSPDPTFSELVGGRIWLFDMNRNYSKAPDGLRFTGTFTGTFDFSRRDHIEMGLELHTTNANGTTFLFGTTEGDLTRIVLEDEDGVEIFPDFSNTLTESVTGNILVGRKNSYFLTDRTSRAAIKKIHIDIWFSSPAGIRSDAQMGIFWLVGDPFMNDDQQIDLEAGSIQDNIAYRYTRTASGSTTESNLSSQTFNTGIVPVNFQSMTERIGYEGVTGSITGDLYSVYRQQKADEQWYQVGTQLFDSTQTTLTNSNPTGSLWVEDFNMEHELVDLPKFEGFTIDNTTNPQAIGKHRGSLVLGIGKNAFISWINRPEQFVAIGQTPSTAFETRGRSIYVDDNQAEDINMIIGSDILYLGTRSNVYIMFGNFPKDLSAPRSISNNGPIGSRAFARYQKGVTVLNEEGIWALNPTVVGNNDIGSINSIEITQDIEQSLKDHAAHSGSVLVQHRGDLWAFTDDRYLKFDRKTGAFYSGTLNHNVIVALPDRSNNMRVIASDGALLEMQDGTTHAGSPIIWSYETGDIRNTDSRITDVIAICSGSPTMRIESFYGDKTSNDVTYTLQSWRDHITPFRSGQSHGNRYKFTFSGSSSNDVVKAVQIEFTKTDATQDN